ncbi:MAG TPA: TolC family protein [Acidobacteriota bacterium]|nr:TolC family protein [Acidobacteriota bacterium]
MSAQHKPSGQEEPGFFSQNPQVELYVREALRRNPALAQALAGYRAALQKVPQVTALPDPMVTFSQFVRSVETRVGPQLNSLALSQKFPWFGKLSAKGQVAFKEAAAMHQVYLARQREIISQVKAAYYDLAYVDRAQSINRQEQALLEQYEALAQARYASGQGLQQAVIKIQAEITKLVNQLLILQRQRTSLASRLNTLLDRQPENPVPPTLWTSVPEVSLDLDELYEMGRRHRQELKAAMARVEAGEKKIELAGKSFWPDITLRAGFTNLGERSDPAALVMPPLDNGKDAYSFSIGLNLPIHRKKYRAEVIEATEGLIARRKEYLNLQNEVEFGIRDQVIRVETLQSQIDLFERILVPQAEEALRSTESAYQTGEAAALDLLDSERVLLEVRLIEARYQADLLRALSDLERALGTRFPR